MTGVRIGESLYQQHATPTQYPIMGMTASSHSASQKIGHQRLGHINGRTLSRMAAGIGVTGMDIKPGDCKLDDCCDGCNLGKMHKLPFPTSTHKPQQSGN